MTITDALLVVTVFLGVTLGCYRFGVIETFSFEPCYWFTLGVGYCWWIWGKRAL